MGGLWWNHALLDLAGGRSSWLSRFVVGIVDMGICGRLRLWNGPEGRKIAWRRSRGSNRLRCGSVEKSEVGIVKLHVCLQGKLEATYTVRQAWCKPTAKEGANGVHGSTLKLILPPRSSPR